MATPIAPRRVTAGGVGGSGGGGGAITATRPGRLGRRRSTLRRGPGMSRVFVLCPSCGADNHIRRAYCRRCFRAKDTPSSPQSVTAAAAIAGAAEVQRGCVGSSCRRANTTATATATATAIATSKHQPVAGAETTSPLNATGPWKELPVSCWLQTLLVATMPSVTDVTPPTNAPPGKAEQQCIPAVFWRPAQCGAATPSAPAKATPASPRLPLASEPSAVTSVTLVPPSRAGRCEDDTTWATSLVDPLRTALDRPLYAQRQSLPEYENQRLYAHGWDASACTSLVTADGEGATTPTYSNTSRESGGHDSCGTRGEAHTAPSPSTPEDMGDLIDQILS